MELLRSLTIDAAPSLLDLFRFALVTALEAIRSVLLLYPVNVLIFVLVVAAAVHSMVSRFKGKKKFSAVYTPLRHHENSLEEVKLLKKEVRDVQTELINMLKRSKQAEQHDHSQEKSLEKEHRSEVEEAVEEQIAQFLKEEAEKSEIIEMVEEELKRTVKDAYDQIVKLNSN